MSVPLLPPEPDSHNRGPMERTSLREWAQAYARTVKDEHDAHLKARIAAIEAHRDALAATLRDLLADERGVTLTRAWGDRIESLLNRVKS